MVGPGYVRWREGVKGEVKGEVVVAGSSRHVELDVGDTATLLKGLWAGLVCQM